MPAKAYINEKWLHLFFEETDFTHFKPISYNLGGSLTGFLRIKPEEIEELLDELISKTLNIKGGRLSMEHEQWLEDALSSLCAKSPFLCYYADILLGVLLSIAKGKLYDMTPVFTLLPRTNELYEHYSQKFEKDSENADEILAPYYAAEYLESRPRQQKVLMLRSINNILFIKEAILGDVTEKKNALSEALEFLLDGTDEDGTTSSQRLLCYDAARAESGKKPFYINRELNVRYAPFSDGGKKELSEPHSSLTMEYIKENGVEVFELYSVNWVDDLIRLELMKVIETDALIKRCGNCGRLFAPSGRIDTLYCGEPFEDTGKTCAEIGAMKKYREKTLQNPAHEAFNKAYKRNNSRVRNNKMTKQEFSNWLVNAKKMRAACADGEIGIAEFSEWLGNKK